MTGVASDLASLGAAIDWPDAEAAALARSAADRSAGRLADLSEWLAGVQGGYPPVPPRRARLVVATRGPLPSGLDELAASVDAGVRPFEVPADVDAAVAAGAAAADEEADLGTDLLVVAAAFGTAGPVSAAVVVSLLCQVEPVLLLPRGALATDTDRWIERAGQLREARHAAAPLRTDPDALLRHLDDPVLAGVVGLLLQGASRREAMLLDGVTAAVAGVVVATVASRASRWWRVADTDPDPAQAPAIAEYDQRPLLDLARNGDGTSGLLCVPLLRAAAIASGAS